MVDLKKLIGNQDVSRWFEFEDGLGAPTAEKKEEVKKEGTQ